MTFRALALRPSESMDCWLCMAHTPDTSNGGATIIILVFHVSMFCVLTSSAASPFDIQYWLKTPRLSSERQLFISLRLIKFLISLELVRICQCFTFRPKNSWKHENVSWLQNWKRRRFGRVSRTLDFSKLKSWTSPKPFSSCLKPLFQSEARSETRCIDMKKIFYSHTNKMAVFMPTLTSSCVVHTHLTDDFNV